MNHSSRISPNSGKNIGDFKRNENSIENRSRISTQIFNAWKIYVEKRSQEIPEDLQISPKVKSNMWSVFNSFKKRNSNKVEGTVLLDFLNEYVKIHRFQIAIDPEILLKQIHPFYGHMTKIDQLLAFEDIYSLFEHLLVASYEKLQGQTLLSSEICAYALWRYQDNNNLGFFNMSESSKFLRSFDFDIKDWEDFQKEFSFAIRLDQNMFLWEADKTLLRENILPFDFFRYIYLERNF